VNVVCSLYTALVNTLFLILILRFINLKNSCL